MLRYNDQDNLFKLIGNSISEDIECYAFGGTAMMYYGFKDETKDVDILFEEEKQREQFISALRKLGFEQTTAFKVYSLEKSQDKSVPLMYKRDDYRFDLFLKKIFKTMLSPTMKEDLYAVHDYKGKYNFRIKVLKEEFIVLLKSVTNREKDFEDILNIVQKDTKFNWEFLMKEVLWQAKQDNDWIVLDIEETLQELRKYVFIEEKYFEMLYEMIKAKKK